MYTIYFFPNFISQTTFHEKSIPGSIYCLFMPVH